MTPATENNIIKIFSRLDVPGNAAKIYLFLLKNGPASGYKITKVSGVNSGVVYRELERLKSKNLVFQLGVNQKKYEAINGNGLIEILKRQNKSEESLLEKSLNELLKGSDTLISVKITEYDDLIYEVQKEIEFISRNGILYGGQYNYDKMVGALKTELTMDKNPLNFRKKEIKYKYFAKFHHK